ncbi:hypothetical protein [Leptolyngbya sp. FACHB-711]|uniref:hypothetical protein n=1 Tax=unclassified Leptolyngbya TaxID=2650499 RepID=UPI0016884B78|nr:hypothetical protein [Leptolyngbya sp. FACHB-711]MBD1850457.1 hypothetical protein [Cyanobacteria bacterium FACHB-502]MBD2026041.1 hypothetical protein [Leptolyngbya sp. FACHB-711]
MRLGRIAVLLSFIGLIGLLGYGVELSLPRRGPSLNKTLTPITTLAPAGIGSYDVLGIVVDRPEAEQLLQTEAGQQQLSRENGAIEVTQDLIDLGRKAFYTETFGNEYFFTDVMGAIDGGINLVNLSRAIVALGGKATTNLQVKLDRDYTVGGRAFPKGTVLNTGLDVPAGSLIPVGMEIHKKGGKVQVGITCAACHAAVDQRSGLVIEGAPNIDLDSGLLLAFATNSAAMFRQTGVNPLKLPGGEHTYINAAGKTAKLVDAKAFEDAVDADFLSWAPGNFDSSPDNVDNPAQNPSSYTHEAYPYGWSGFSSIGWFHGLTTLNNNVHATNSDPSTALEASLPLLGIDKETYLGSMLQNAANPKFRLPKGAKPSEFFDQIDPTPGEPGMNQVIRMPGFPKGSLFAIDGLMASSPGLPVGEQLNGMSAYQNTLAPPPHESDADSETLQRGAKVFTEAGCISCHSGRYFNNHQVIGEIEIKGQPSRAKALAKIPGIFTEPKTYPPSLRVPLPADPPVLKVPTEIAPLADRELAFAQNNPAGGYKVQHLIGLYLSAPYLHDGGVAATQAAIAPNEDGWYQVVEPEEMGLAGTWMRRVEPDPEASLRVLVDRNLREAAVQANRKNEALQNIHSDGSGHNYWVDRKAGFTPEDQTAIVQFMLAIDDDPAVLPTKEGEPIVATNGGL